MHLVQLKVSNFRCFKEETTVSLDNLVVLIGKNDSGKSSILDAMNIFLALPDSVWVHVTRGSWHLLFLTGGRVALRCSDAPARPH